ncbi:MAG: YbaK/EbsC family protein [Chloroflexota bacterium]
MKKTVVIRLLEGKKIAHQICEYPTGITDATEVAHRLGVPPDQVFKTLVAYEQPEKKLLVMIPANKQLDLKKLAKVVGVKKMKMATHKEAEAFTGLQVGGISALALLNRGFKMLMAQEASRFDDVFVSAAERGINVKIGVKDLLKLTNARLVDVVTEDEA